MNRLIPGFLLLLIGTAPAWSQQCATSALFLNQAVRSFADPTGIVQADLNLDGFTDVVISSFSSSNLRVHYGTESGALGQVEYIDTPQRTTCLTLGDLNNDGLPDLAFGSSSRNVGAVLNLGDGQFSEPLMTDSMPWVESMHCVDLDLDGKLDLIYQSSTVTDIEIRFGNGDGTFESRAVLNAGGRVRSLAVDDITGDGIPDILAGRFLADQLNLMIGEGQGIFAEPIVYALDHQVHDIRTADLDHDGLPEVLAASSAGFTVFRNFGGGALLRGQTIELPNGLNDFAVGDLNGDPYPDVAWATTFSSDVDIVLGREHLEFEHTASIRAGIEPRALTIGEFRGQNHPDIMVASALLCVLEGNGDGTFIDTTMFETGDFPGECELIDANQDEWLDLLVVNEHDNTIGVYFGLGDGNFGVPYFLSTLESPSDIATGDFNLDGRMDFAVSHYGANRINVYLGQDLGLFVPGVTVIPGDPSEGIATGDLDGDGKPELISTHVFDDYISIWQGLGNGRFGVRTNYDVDFDPEFALVHDLDQDGFADVIVSNKNSGTLSIFHGSASGIASDPVEVSTGIGPSDFNICDLNDDGINDIVIASPGAGASADNRFTVLIGIGDGSFQPRVQYDSLSDVRDIETADYNNDGIIDVIVTNAGYSVFSVHLGLGDGTFGEATSFLTGGHPNNLITHDFNRDGLPDVLVTCGFERTVRILFNQCATLTACPPDLNSDGDLDFFDVSAFIVAFSQADPIADFNADGDLDFFDVSAFIVAFNAGCP